MRQLISYFQKKAYLAQSIFLRLRETQNALQ